MDYLGEKFEINEENKFLHMFRLKAILISNGKLYEGKEHVDILMDTFNMDYEYIDISNLEFSGKIQTFDLLEDANEETYVVAHYQDFLKGNLEIIKEYAKTTNAKIGMYYVTKDFKCEEYIMI